jgi:WD40 repeat protein
MAWSGDDERLLFASAGGGLRQWRIRTGEVDPLAEGATRIPTVAAMADGPVAWGDVHGRVFIKDPGSISPRLVGSHRAAVSSVSFSGDGSWLVSGGEDATVRVWPVNGGPPRWRGIALLRDPAEVLTHLGWRMPGAEGEPAGGDLGGWRRQVEHSLGVSQDQELLCLARAEGWLELWDRDSGLRRQRTRLDGVDELMAIGGRCVVTDGEKVLSVDADGVTVVAEGGAQAIGQRGGQLLVASADSVVQLAPDGGSTPLLPSASGVTALLGLEDAVLLGFDNGDLELRRIAGTGTQHGVIRVFDDVPSAAVTALGRGPGDLILAGYASGFVGVWQSSTGTLLVDQALHGSVIGLVFSGDQVVALSELGSWVALDLSDLIVDYCEVVREVWGEVPTLWRDGRPLAAPPPESHPCR